LGNTGTLLRQQDSKEPACDGKADAFGLSGGGEVGLQVGRDLDTKALGVLEGLEVGLELAELILKQGELLLMRSSVEVTQSGVSLAVKALAGETALLGVEGDSAVWTEEDTRSTGESLKGSYDTHG
jgi:hypothetical protein